VDVASRFKRAVEGHDWSREDRRLTSRPVKVDVGVICLRLGDVDERRGVGRKLAAELIQRADKLMYEAKGTQSSRVHAAAVRVLHGQLADLPQCGFSEKPPPSEGPTV
jgi:PleD family two-component response regulator